MGSSSGKSLSMSQKATKIGLTCVVLVLAFGGLLYSTLSEGTEYYKHVDEVMADPGAWYGKNLQLHGFVQGEPRASATRSSIASTCRTKGRSSARTTPASSRIRSRPSPRSC